jgi:sugar phosphate permease
MVERQGLEPHTDAVLDQDPMALSWQRAISYVLRVRSNVILIVASALGYFFLSGLETFALIYLKGHYGISQELATLVVLLVGGAAVVGTLVGGRLSDTLLRHGRIDARLVVAAVGYIVVAFAIVPALISSLVAVSLPLFVIAGFSLAAPNPGLDAARLDVMPSRMWGRAEAVRSLLRSLLQAFAPLVFGLTSVLFGGHSQGLASGARSSSSAVSAAQTAGLEPTFLIMVLPILVAGIVVWRGRRYYPGDVAAANLSEQRFPPDGSAAT